MQKPDTTIAERASAAASEAAERAEATWELLTDPAFWFSIASTAIRVGVILLLAFAMLALARRITGRWQRRVRGLPAIDPRRQRTLTVANLVNSAAAYAVWTFATITVLAQVGVNVGPLLAGAGIAGLAIGFGAQTLVRDVISGVFLLFDDVIHVGDIITFGATSGAVEAISLRLVKVRKFDGELVMIPAGELRTFGNKSIGFARVIVDVNISYEQDVDAVLAALGRVAREWAERPENKAVLLQEAPEVLAVMSLGDSGVRTQIAAQVVPGEQWRGERDLRLLIKQRFDEWGIEIPFPRQTVYMRPEPEPPPREVELPPDDDAEAPEAAD